MIERILLFVFFATWVISLIGTFAFGVKMSEHKNLEKYAMGCGIVALATTLIIVSVWWY
jgi:hypothetical protein